MSRLDTMNHEQRARFARLFYHRPSLPHTVATKLLMERIAIHHN